MKYTYTYSLNSGITLGGIGAGCFELRADGRTYAWYIFNNGPWASRRELRSKEYLDQDSLLLAVRVSDGNRTVVRLLRAGEYYYGANPYTLPWLRPIESIEYSGEPPFAFLQYHDRSLDEMLDIRLEAFSPFIPGDLKNSSLPVAIFKFTIRNKLERELEISLLAGLKSPFETTRARKIDNGVILEGDVIDGNDPRLNGSMYLGFINEEASVSIISVPHPMRIYYNVAREFIDSWVQLRSSGIVRGRNEYYGQNAWALISVMTKLGPREEREFVLVLTWFFPNHVDEFGEILGHYYENFFKNAFEVYEYIAKNLEQIYRKTRDFHDLLYGVEGIEKWISDLVGSQLTSLHKLTWLTRDGRFGIWEGIGEHYYTGPEAAALSTTDVATYIIPTLISLFPELAKKYIEYNARYQLMRSSPYYLIYVLSYPENKELFIEEFKRVPSIVSDLKKALKIANEIARKTGRDPAGRVMHFFSSSIKRVDSYHMVELMPKFILDVYMISIWTGDKELLGKLYGSMRQAYESIVMGQSIGGLLPYHTYPAGFDWTANIETQGLAAELPDYFARLLVSLLGERSVPMGFQTFDVWTFYGVSAYVSILWLGALRALEEASKILGYDGREYYEKYRLAVEQVYKLLWNNEYFRLWYDPISGARDEACMAAQLLGQWLSTLSNLGYVVDRDKVISTLRSIAKRNLIEGEGLVNGIYPSGNRPALKGLIKYENPLEIPFFPGSQMDTPWSGVEYFVASHMLYEGLVDEAVKILREVHERYIVSGHYWNHVEWGSHYMRPLSSWSVILGTEGVIYNGFTRVLRVSPAIRPLKWIFTISGSWGLFEDSGEALKIEIRHGALKLRELRIGRANRVNRIHMPFNAKYEILGSEGEVVIRFETDVELNEGDIIIVHYE